MPETAPLVEKGSREERFEIDHCFYCQEAIGTPHKDDCVMWKKKVKVRAMVEYEIEVPNSWDKKMVEFHRNEGTWCSNNMISELEKSTEEYVDDDGVYHSGCICMHTKFTVVDEFTPWLEPEYEYAAMRIRNRDRAQMASPDLNDDRHWDDCEEDVAEHVKVMNEAALEGQYYSYVVAKRVKAGEIEY